MGNGRGLRIGLAVLLVMLVTGASAALAVDAAATKTFASTPLATGPLIQTDPETEGDLVVWESLSLIPGSAHDVSVRNLTDASSATLGSGDAFDQYDPDVSQGRVVYVDDSAGNANIRIYDSWLNANYALTTSADKEVMPRISGNLVAWHNATTEEIWYRDLARGNTAKVPGATDVSFLDVDRGRIFWSYDGMVTQDVYVFDPSRDATSRKFYTAPSGDDIDSLSAYGDWAAVTRNNGGTLSVRRENTEAQTPLSFPLYSSFPSLFHNGVAWQWGSGQQDINWSSETLIDPDSDSGDVANTVNDETRPSAYGNRVVYQYVPVALSSDIYMATTATEVERTEGDNRYLTAVEASRAYFMGAKVAVLCTGLNFPDALAAGPLARLVGGPLLLTKPDAVSSAVLGELDRLKVETVYVVGGPDVVSEDVVDQLRDLDYSVKRIAGSDRYATSVAIANVMDEWLSGAHDVDMAFFARGDNFPDALAVGPVAAGALSPVILVKPTSVPGAVAGAVDDLNLKNGIIVGGVDVVNNDVRDQLIAIMQDNGAGQHPIERWSGDDRYATAVDVIENGVANRWIDLDTVGIATGRNFPDALGGGAALGHYGSPLLLVKETVPSSVSAWVKANKRAIGRMDVFGGPDVVPESVKSTLTTLVN